MKIEYIKVQEGSWGEVKDSALTTIHKKYTGKEVTTEWKVNMLRSEHSPIRELVVRVKFSGVKRWVSDQLVRHHIGFQPQMGTARTDRTGVPRSEQSMEMPTVLKVTMNAQAIINISSERLCVGCVSPETRKLWEDFLVELAKQEPELVFHCVPSCIYRCGCKEFKPCNHFNNFLLNRPDAPWDSMMNIHSRYEQYHRWRDI